MIGIMREPIPKINRDQTNNIKFWMNLIKPIRKEKDNIDIEKYKIKIYESIICVIVLIQLILAQVEYEYSYFPTFYSKMIETEREYVVINKNAFYEGNKIRVIVALLNGLISIL
jgi:hypothetical protein